MLSTPSQSLQTTIKRRISCRGVGLHSGMKINMALVPAAPNSGIRFIRTDGRHRNRVIAASYAQVSDSRLCTLISNDDQLQVGTIEHVMAALAGLGIDNLDIEISGIEVPIMDGSADPFVFLTECAGITTQDAPKKVIEILRPVRVEENGCSASYTPAGQYGYSFEIDFATKTIGRQSRAFNLQPGSFKRDLARARTFGFLHEVDALRAAGLARGGSLDNAIVINSDGVMNEGGLRFNDEFVRHKLLDAVGDLYLAGHLVLGQYSAVKAGHRINNLLLRALFADSRNYRLIDAPQRLNLAAAASI